VIWSFLSPLTQEARDELLDSDYPECSADVEPVPAAAVMIVVATRKV